MAEDSEPPPNREAEIVLSSSGVKDDVEEDTEVLQTTDCSPSEKCLEGEVEVSDAPKG